MPILTGIFLGLTTLLFIGPVFFYLLKSSVESGFKAGLAVAIGIIVGDIICVLLVFYDRFEIFFKSPENQKWIAGIGGVILLFFGLKYFFNPSLKETKSKKNLSKSLLVYGINGFLINFVNPFVFAVWFGFYTLNQSKYEDNSVVLSLIVTLMVIFATDLLKAYFAQKLSPFLNKKRLFILFKVFGIIMIAFSIRLIVTFYQL